MSKKQSNPPPPKGVKRPPPPPGPPLVHPVKVKLPFESKKEELKSLFRFDKNTGMLTYNGTGSLSIKIMVDTPL